MKKELILKMAESLSGNFTAQELAALKNALA